MVPCQQERVDRSAGLESDRCGGGRVHAKVLLLEKLYKGMYGSVGEVVEWLEGLEGLERSEGLK